jgi:hypothetical protein
VKSMFDVAAWTNGEKPERDFWKLRGNDDDGLKVDDRLWGYSGVRGSERRMGS